jgi:hypothetical protein
MDEEGMRLVDLLSERRRRHLAAEGRETEGCRSRKTCATLAPGLEPLPKPCGAGGSRAVVDR